jgi:hypothetical protein
MVVVLDCWHLKKKTITLFLMCNPCMELLNKKLQWSLLGHGLGFGFGLSVEIDYHGLPKL